MPGWRLCTRVKDLAISSSHEPHPPHSGLGLMQAGVPLLPRGSAVAQGQLRSLVKAGAA